MSPEPIDEAYFRWLTSKVVNFEAPLTPSTSYWKLLSTLYNTEFVWFLPNDDNRVKDGQELRVFFLRETNFEADQDWMSLGCSVLEMLIAFAYRAEFQTEIPPAEWFWKFIENLDLIRFNDISFDGTDDIANILETFIWRTYQPNGQGGLFPINHPSKDQRKVEIWYQFCEYLMEHEPV
jgi:hypothetical protein